MQSAAVVPLPPNDTVEAAKAAGGATVSNNTATSSSLSTLDLPNRLTVSPSSSQPSSARTSVVSPRVAPASISSFHRLSRLERISTMCSTDSSEGSQVSVGELLVTLAYLSRSLNAEESGRVHAIVDSQGSGSTAISMRAFSRLISDCLDRERELEAALAGQTLSNTEESHRAFVLFALTCLALHVKDSADLLAVNASVSRQTLTDELAAARQSARQAEQSNKQLTDRLDRLQAHCRRIEEDNTRLTGQQQASSSRQSSDTEALQSVQAANHHYQQVLQRMTAALQQSELALNGARSEHQSSLALLQFERSAKQSLQHEMAAATEQISALQASRSSEMRQALKRKKEEMAAIMDSHRYTKELKAQAMRVPTLEQEAAVLRSTISQLQDDVAEYKRLLNDWQIASGDGQPLNMRNRPAFSLCDDLDMDGNCNSGSASRAASASHSRHTSTIPSTSAAAVITALELKLTEQSHELDVMQVELTNAQRSGERLTAQRDALVLQIKQVSEKSEMAEKQQQISQTELTQQVEALQGRLEQCTQLQHRVDEAQQAEQRWQERLKQWEDERQRLLAQHAAELEAARQAAREKELAMEAAVAKLAKLESLMQLLNDDHNNVRRQMEEAHQREVDQLRARLTEWEQRVASLSAELADWRRRAEEADALLRSQLNAANDSTEATRLMAERLAEQRADMDRQVANADRERQAAEKRLRELQATLDDLSARHTSTLAELSTLRSELSTCAASLSSCESKLRRLEMLYPATLEEVEALRRRVAELDEEVRRLEADRARLQAQIDSHVCSAAVVQLTEADVSQPLTANLAAAELDRPQALLVNETALPSQSSLIQPPAAALWREVPLSASQQTEVRAYGTFVNQRLHGDPDLAHLLPVRCDNGELLAKLGDGLLLAKLINVAEPALIDDRVLNRRQAGQVLAWQQIAQNLNIVISAAKSIGITMRTVGAAQDRQQAAVSGTATPAGFTALQVVDDLQPPINDVDVIDLSASSRVSAASVLVDAGSSTARASAQSHYHSAVQNAQRSGAVEDEAEVASTTDQSRSTSSRGSINNSAEYSTGPTGRALDAGSAQAQFSECTQPPLVIDFIHQIIRHSLTHNLDTKHNGRLLALTTLPSASRRGSVTNSVLAPLSIDALACLPHDALLIRWANFQLLMAQSTQTADNIEPLSSAGAQLQSGAALHRVVDAIVSFQLTEQKDATDSAPRDMASVISAWQTLAGNRDALLQSLFSRLDAMHVPHFHTADALTAEHDRLQMLLLATLCQYCDALPDRAADNSALSVSSGEFDVDDGEEATREEQAFRSWINSAGIPNVRVHSLVNDCRDGLLLLRLIDWVERGCVDWKRVEMRPSNKFKSVTNCNYAVQLCNDTLRFNLVNIAGNDIYDGNKKLTLSVMWQLMRYSALKRLELIRQQSGKKAGNAGGKLTDADILTWANGSVASCTHAAAQLTHSTTLRSFRDPSCTTGIFLLNLLHSINGTVVDWTQVHVQPSTAATAASDLTTPVVHSKSVDSAAAGLSVAERCSNARYAISVARKLGAEVFMLPEDLVEVRPKMLLLFIGSLYCVKLLGGIE